LDQHPQLNQETKAIIDHLKPKPANLRNLSSLKLMTDDERFRLIREGHLRSGMLPDTTLTDEEIVDILAYLFALRREAASQGTPKQ
jgi:hypothetical protein